jgi:hypothetical protein
MANGNLRCPLIPLLAIFRPSVQTGHFEDCRPRLMNADRASGPSLPFHLLGSTTTTVAQSSSAKRSPSALSGAGIHSSPAPGLRSVLTSSKKAALLSRAFDPPGRSYGRLDDDAGVWRDGLTPPSSPLCMGICSAVDVSGYLQHKY